jgi:protein TonB
MSAARLIVSLVFAFVVTSGLVLTMHLLIKSNLAPPDEGEEFKIPDITMDNREVREEFDTAKVEKPEDVEEPPPDVPEPEFDSPDLDNSISIAPKVGVKVNVGGIGGLGQDGDYLPIVKVNPRYPSRAQSRGIEGYCTVKYVVTTTGETRDVQEADCPNRVFLSASIKAAQKFKYKPKVVDGEPIEVPGVHNRFIFELAD